MLNQVILYRAANCLTGDTALGETGGTNAHPGQAFRSSGSFAAMIVAIWLSLLAMVVLTSSL